MQIQPPRVPWNQFPDVVIHAPETSVKKHPAYRDAKAGDDEAAHTLVVETLSAEAVRQLLAILGEDRPFLASAHAFERDGVNAIPEALADELAGLTGLQVDGSIVQTNIVGHTGADGFSRLARQAIFSGDVVPGASYALVDDFIGQGGTLANLRGYIESNGGRVIAATVLTGKPYSAKLAISHDQLLALRTKHNGKNLESWWLDRFGHAFDCLTQSEARYLERTQDADVIRDRIAAQEQAGNC